MSGGLWDYQDQKEENYTFKNISEIIYALMKVFHEIDWAESGDKNRKEVEPIIYDIMLKLAYNLFWNGD